MWLGIITLAEDGDFCKMEIENNPTRTSLVALWVHTSRNQKVSLSTQKLSLLYLIAYVYSFPIVGISALFGAAI